MHENPKTAQNLQGITSFAFILTVAPYVTFVLIFFSLSLIPGN
jgi:hypothetical protein